MQENLPSGFANNKGADQPAHPGSLINTYVIRLLEGIISRLAKRRFTFARIDISYARFFSTKARKKYYHMGV